MKQAQHYQQELPYRLDIYEPLNITSSRIVRVVAASGLAQEFRIVLQTKVKIKNSANSVYSRLDGILHSRPTKLNPHECFIRFHILCFLVSSELRSSLDLFLRTLLYPVDLQKYNNVFKSWFSSGLSWQNRKCSTLKTRAARKRQ